MGIQYFKKLIRAVFPAEYRCMPRNTKSEVKDYGTYRRKTWKEEREEMRNERKMRKELKDKERQQKEEEGEERKRTKEKSKDDEKQASREKMSKTSDKPDGEKKKRRRRDTEKLKDKDKEEKADSKRHKDEDKEEKAASKRNKDKDKEEKAASKRNKDKDKEDKAASKRKKDKDKEGEPAELSRQPSLSERLSKFSLKSVDKDMEKKKCKSRGKWSDSEAEEDARSEGKPMKKQKKKKEEAPEEFEFKITDVIDDGYPATPIIVVVEKNRVNKPENAEMDEHGYLNDVVSCSKRTCNKRFSDRSVSRKVKNSCASTSCPAAMRRMDKKPVTKEDIQRFEKIMMKFLESKDGCLTKIDSSEKQHKNRQKSGQCSSVEIPTKSFVDSPKLFAHRAEDSIASLNPTAFKYNEQSSLLQRNEFWQSTQLDQDEASTELISIAEYWEFVPDKNMSSTQGSIGSTIIVDDESIQAQDASNAVRSVETSPVNANGIWSKGRYYRIETPAGILKKDKLPGGEFYRIDVPVCLSKNKCPFCKKYELMKQGIEIENSQGPKRYQGVMNPECFEYCTCMTMLDKANTTCCKRKK